MKVSFIGFGNMASALCRGFLEAHCLAPDQMMASAKDAKRLQVRAGQYGIQAAADNTACAAWGDVVILAVKPWLVQSVVEEMGAVLAGKLVISIAANITFDQLSQWLPEGARAVVVMPNTPISVGEGILVVDAHNSMTEEDKALLVRLFEPCALIAFVSSEQMKAAGTVAGCSPAFVAMFMEALADAGVKHGLGRQLAQDLAAKVTEGTGRLLLDSHMHPGQLKDAVCSPGGTTIKGVAALEKDGFRGDVMDAIDTILT